MNTDTKTWLNIYLEHARNYVHATPQELEVVSHVWWVAWREGWQVVLDYISQHVPIYHKRFVESETETEFVWVPPGSFWMGWSTVEGERGFDEDLFDEDWFDEDSLGCEVELTRGYWMARHPVTRAQYQLFMEATGYSQPGGWRDTCLSYPKKPVVCVSWYNAADYCRWLTESGALPPGVKATLPTEAQWERAARGVDGRKYPWGNESPNETLAYFGLDSETGSPAEIGERPEGRSPVGCEDMAGNVDEWCLDHPSDDLKHLQTNNVDPCRIGGSFDRVVRGGAWGDLAMFLRCAFQGGNNATYSSWLIGFRVCCVFEHAP